MIEVRIRYGKGARKRFEVATESRAAALRALARTLTKGKVDPERSERMLDDAAKASDGELKAIEALAVQLGAGKVRPKAAKPAADVVTFRTVGESWTSDDMHKRFPDQISKIFQDFNIQRLERHIYPVLGDVPIREVTRALCDDVMRRLPEKLKSRRHIAALLNRVLNLAELAGYIQRSPLPRGWLPKPLPRKLWAVLYVAEDRALLACDKIPLSYRLLYGFLHREFMRKSEATTLRWRSIDLENGTVELDANKTDHARFWRLGPGVADALAAWHAFRGKPGPDELVFTDDAGGPWVSEHMAVTLRLHLKAAGLTRPALFAKGELKGRFGLHSFRRSAVTRSLANGLGEDWVRVRSGHKSSELLRYRQGAKALADLEQGELDPLANALPELAPTRDPQPVAPVAVGPGPGPRSGPRMQSEGGGIGRRTSLRCSQESVADDAEAGNKGVRDAGESAKVHESAPCGPQFGPISDPVESALSEAILRASRDGRHDLIPILVDELRARRLERQKVAGVIDLASERERRGR